MGTYPWTRSSPTFSSPKPSASPAFKRDPADLDDMSTPFAR